MARVFSSSDHYCVGAGGVEPVRVRFSQNMSRLRMFQPNSRVLADNYTNSTNVKDIEHLCIDKTLNTTIGHTRLIRVLLLLCFILPAAAADQTAEFDFSTDNARTKHQKTTPVPCSPVMGTTLLPWNERCLTKVVRSLSDLFMSITDSNAILVDVTSYQWSVKRLRQSIIIT